MAENQIPEGHKPDPDDLYDDRGQFHLHGRDVRVQRERDKDPEKKAADDWRHLKALATAARKRLTGKGELDYEAMSTDELAALRVVMKREYESEREKSSMAFSQKVTADRFRDSEKAMGLPEGSIHTVVAPPPADAQVEGQ